MPITRDMVRDTASTLAHLWTGADKRDQLGVERIIRSHDVALRPALCAHIMRYLELRGAYTRAASFEAMLFDMADVPDDGSSDLKGIPDNHAAGCCGDCRAQGNSWDTPREDGGCYVCGEALDA